MTFADDPTTATDVVIPSGKRGHIARTSSLVPVPSEGEDDAQSTATLVDDGKELDLHVLRLDLKLGPHGSATSPASLVSQLEKSSIANLIDERIDHAVNHVEKLKLRVQDTSSKVLVTGDLNAGKSTFVNALLRREVLPVDQQPLTSMFCEVHDAIENDGVEEVHVIQEGITYDIKDESTFKRAPISELESIVDCAETSSSQGVLKLYVSDMRAPSESLIHNGIVDISLIDAPGLNRDSIKTTALFARQEEIDVVVFVVSAENHFTLSAKEFLWTASNEKAYLFIVVNKFDQIRDKEKCKRLVLEQIKQLSPRTYEDASDLVHFVDSSAVQSPTASTSSFDNLEAALRTFVLVKRSKSKLHPVATFLSRLLGDVEFIASSNTILAEGEAQRARDDLARTRPVFEKMQNEREMLEDSLENVEDEGSSKAVAHTRKSLLAALEKVGQGEPGVDRGIMMPTYPGLLNIWEYATDVRRALLASLDAAVKAAEDDARSTTVAGVRQISNLADKHLPEGVERSRRVFMPEAMFSPKAKAGKRNSTSAIVAGGMYGLGIGLAQRSEMMEVSFFDIFDVQHQISVHFGDEKSTTTSEGESSSGALSVVSIGFGALSVAGGKALGPRGIVEGLVRVSDFFANENTRKWIAPVVGAVALGFTVYFVLELPQTVPRNIGRRIKHSLTDTADPSGNGQFVQAHEARVGKETRKVLRLASWDLRERFRVAMEERGKEVKVAEELERNALRAIEFFGQMTERTEAVRGKVEGSSN